MKEKDINQATVSLGFGEILKHSPGILRQVKQDDPNLTPEEIANGHNYCETIPSAFIVGHVDYVRVVRVLPLGPEETSIHAQWLFSPEALAGQAFDPTQTIAFGEKLIQQDGAISELNQKGLRSIRHQRGVLMAEEYYVHAFHDWLKSHFD